MDILLSYRATEKKSEWKLSNTSVVGWLHDNGNETNVVHTDFIHATNIHNI